MSNARMDESFAARHGCELGSHRTTQGAALTHWSEQYLGLPYAPQGRSLAGLDCWGLCWVVLPAFGLPVPSYAGEYASEQERAEIAGLIDGAKPQWQRVEYAEELDLVTFRRGRIDAHVGVVVRPGLMLHVTKDKPSCIERYDTGYWANRLTGIWRHAASTEKMDHR